MLNRSITHNLFATTFFTISSLTLCSSEQGSFQISWPSVQELIENPLEVQNQVKRNHASFKPMTYEECQPELSKYPEEQVPAALFALQELRLKEHQHKNGLTFQSECTHPDCLVSRQNNPSYRAQFTESISQKILTSLKSNPGRATQYVTFASGSLFIDLIIMAKVLTKKPDAAVVMHFIDPLYKPYKILKGAINTTPLDAVDFHDVKEKIKIRTTSTSKNSCDEVFFLHQAFQEFMSYLKNNFPESSIVPYVHPSAKKYLKLVRSEKIPAADITAAADLDDALAEYDYALLAERTLVKNPNSSHSFLRVYKYLSGKESPFHTLYLAPAPGMPLFLFKNDKGDKLRLSISSK